MDFSSPSVVVGEDRISAQASGVPLGEVLAYIEQMTGIEFEADESLLEEKIFVDFEKLPLPEGIKKLLPSNNYAIIYDSSGRIDKVVIVARDKSTKMIRPHADDQDAAATSAGADAGLPDNSETQQLQPVPNHSKDKSQPAKPIKKGPPGVEEASQEAPPGSKRVVPKEPPWEADGSQGPPRGSDPTVHKGPPGTDTTRLDPPPGSERTVPTGPPWAQPGSQDPPSNADPIGSKGPPGTVEPVSPAPPDLSQSDKK